MESLEHPWKPEAGSHNSALSEDQGWESGTATSRNKERVQRQMPSAGRDAGSASDWPSCPWHGHMEAWVLAGSRA